MLAAGQLSLIRVGMLAGGVIFAALAFALGPAPDLHAPFTLFTGVQLALTAAGLLGSLFLRASGPAGLSGAARRQRELIAAALLEGPALNGAMLTLAMRDPWPLLIGLAPLAMLAALVVQDLTSS